MKMNPTDLLKEINAQAEEGPLQCDDSLEVLEVVYAKMFFDYCGCHVPFEIKNAKGQIKLLGYL